MQYKYLIWLILMPLLLSTIRNMFTTTARLFNDRIDAATQLAHTPQLQQYKNSTDAIAIALPRGGVPMAKVISDILNIPMDIIVPRKIGHPNNPEVAIGAITESGVPYWNEPYMRYSELTPNTPAVQQIVREETEEAKRRLNVYRSGRPALQLQNKTAILVDDGVATGATMKAAIVSARAKNARKVVVAVPVAAPDTLHTLQQMADETICLTAPRSFHAVGQFYRIFDQVSDEQVLEIMNAQQQQSPQQRAATTRTLTGTDEIGGRPVRVA